MIQLKLEKDIITKRIEGIETEISELQKLGDEDLIIFKTGQGWKLAQFHMHRALEGVFNISSHILSRIPGGQATQYKEIAQKMGDLGIIDRDFAQTKLTKMAKYRNRLVHFYAEISPEELYKIIKEDLGDFDVFLSAIKKVLINPEKYGLQIE